MVLVGIEQEGRILLVRILNDLSQPFVLGHFALIVGLHLSVPLFLVEISLKESLQQPQTQISRCGTHPQADLACP
jgi:hypothetical protein